MAVTWQALFAEAAEVAPGWAARAALFAAAWLIYLGDRWADAGRLPADAPRSRRQQFCLDHPRVFLVALGSVGLVLLSLLPLLDRGLLVTGGVIGLLSLLYLLANQFAPTLWQRFPLKEATIALLFAAGTCAGVGPVLARSPSLAAAAACFALLCLTNCLSIARWEEGLDRAQGRSSIATSPYGLTALPLLSGGATLAGAVVLLFTGVPLVLFVALAGAALLLLALNLLPGLETDRRTAAADLVLLTPLFVLWG